ncbi:MAG: formyltransferase [Thermoanaerobaculia bacterium]
MSGARILAFAYSDVGYECLRYLLDAGENVAGCYSYSDPSPPAAWPPSVLRLCRERGVPSLADVDWKDPREIHRAGELRPDLILSFYYRELLPGEVLRLPRLGSFNIHGALLPKYRGRAPVNWAVLEGETETGATLHHMTERADAGDIVDSESVPIGPDETAIEIQKKVVAAAVKVLARQLPALKSGTAPRRPQNPALASIRGRRTAEDGKIDWSQSAKRVHDLVRAVTHPFPGAFTDTFAEKTWIWKTGLPGLAAHDAYPGQPFVQENRLFVCCGDDRFIEAIVLQPEGGPEMTAAQWIRAHSVYSPDPKAGG